MQLSPRQDAPPGPGFGARFGAREDKSWFEPTPLRALFAHMLARRRSAQAPQEDRTGYDPSMMGLS